MTLLFGEFRKSLQEQKTLVKKYGIVELHKENNSYVAISGQERLGEFEDILEAEQAIEEFLNLLEE
mgnify:FL=1|tara:strand:- start:186 stop:383 length:198 start_codon:yes stop_codon:yes gene_type:complete